MLLSIIAAGASALNQVLKAQYLIAGRKREQARRRKLGRNIDLYV